MKQLFIAALAMASVACATTPTPRSQATPVPANRLMGFQAPEADSGNLIVTRDQGYLGSGCFYALSINGALAARMDVGESARFFVPPGELLLRVGRDPQGRSLCGVGQDDWTQRESFVKPGETKYFRLSIDANGKTDIQRTD